MAYTTSVGWDLMATWVSSDSVVSKNLQKICIYCGSQLYQD